jgi:hypothetical protein
MCRLDPRQPFVSRIALPFHQAISLESRHDPGHCGRFHLFGARQVSERERTPEHHD